MFEEEREGSALKHEIYEEDSSSGMEPILEKEINRMERENLPFDIDDRAVKGPFYNMHRTYLMFL